MQNRPLNFRLNRYSSLAEGLVFAGLGGRNCVGSAIFADSSDYGNHGTLTNMDPATDWGWSSELGRWCLDFDGSDDYVSIFSNDATKFITPDTWKTLSCWFRCPGDDIECLFGNASYHSDALTRIYGYGLSVKSDATVRLTAGNNNGNPYDNVYGSFSANQWTHVATTVTGSGASQTAKMYINGVLTADWTGTLGSYSFYSDTCLVGCGTGTTGERGQYFAGRASDVMAMTRILSVSEIQQLADPSNVMLSGLILPPTRRFWPVAVSGGETPDLLLPHHGMMGV